MGNFFSNWSDVEEAEAQDPCAGKEGEDLQACLQTQSKEKSAEASAENPDEKSAEKSGVPPSEAVVPAVGGRRKKRKTRRSRNKAILQKGTSSLSKKNS